MNDAEVWPKVKALKASRQWDAARELLAQAAETPGIDLETRRRFDRERSVATYKDESLPTAARLARAFEILDTTDPVALSVHQETLGIAGAIEKRLWEFTAGRDHLELSLAYYRRGAALGVDGDQGYTTINAAYMLDLMAARATATQRQAGAAAHEAMTAWRAEADELRRTVITELAPGVEAGEGGWWLLATLAEAAAGLGQYDLARKYIDRAMAPGDVPRWQFESLVRQLASLLMLRNPVTGVPIEGTDTWRLVAEMFPGSVEGLRSALVGRVGLALSGGGFRASLFHIGVLAAFADMDVLRHVEVLSCVSGGSIVGARYYLELRKLLESKPDAAITRDDYVALVDHLATEFLAGIQSNLRMRVLTTPLGGRQGLATRWSFTLSLAALFERIFYTPVDHRAPHALHTLGICPAGVASDFDGRHDNWQRAHKVPALVLNATSLNTGHIWQFTTLTMGEPSDTIDADVDANEHLRPIAYDSVTERQRDVSLGEAVAASACVPGIFDPLELRGLYPARTVRLVDGGVYDNQGVTGLLGYECAVMLVSDASGHMEDGAAPPSSPLAVPLRSSGILQARVRTAQYRDLAMRRKSLLLRGLHFIHMKKGLDVRPVDAEVAAGGGSSPDAPVAGAAVRTSYGIRKDVQLLLANIRTDLDAFSEAEAYALMTSGYRMARHDFSASVPGIAISTEAAHPWRFLVVEPLMTWATVAPPGYARFQEHLFAARSTFFKLWQQSILLKIAGLLALLGVALQVGLYCHARWNDLVWTPRVTVGHMVLLVALPVLLAWLWSVTSGVLSLVRYRDSLRDHGAKITFGLLGAMAAYVQIRLFDPVYLQYGRVDRFVGTALQVRRRPSDEGA